MRALLDSMDTETLVLWVMFIGVALAALAGVLTPICAGRMRDHFKDGGR